jgi:hypothetical protein
MTHYQEDSMIDVSTSAYEFAHGKRPRGEGSWGFFFDGNRDVSAAWWAPFGSYSQAKAAAVAEAKRRGAVRVEVAS